MNKLLSALAILLVAVNAQAIPTHYTGEISGVHSSYDASLDINFGWVNPPFGLNQWSNDVSLWGIEGTAGEKLSLDLTSDQMSLGFSLYFGVIDSLDLLMGSFNNSADVGAAQYLVGSNLWDSVQTLTDFNLSQTGFYTLVVGGKDFGGYSGYEYSMNVSQVPEPAAFLLLGSGLFGIVALRRRQRRTL